ncbi:hypothetical protein Hoch_6189 [Haliangium ochraceum DSM 14365]|uniref:DUF3829 domain-containing protein n=1 Tax=Haliangium ochraceum (strain DSM 14365 / JCM 11303 / SMP-2) TaxID=502025 RepID=D0LMH7_HALO1|nr:hypothetical protein Hoch_6189 [Haliangium ochraceum DSM 14365]
MSCEYCGAVTQLPRTEPAKPAVATPGASSRMLVTLVGGALLVAAAIAVPMVSMLGSSQPRVMSTHTLTTVGSTPATANPAVDKARAAALLAAEKPAVDPLLARLDAYVKACLNSLDERILSSRARYRAWVDFEVGPKPRSKHIYGLYTFSNPNTHCAESAAAAAALEPEEPALDKAARAYVAAAQELHGLVEEAARYYDRSDYLDDDMARGQSLHAPLMRAFDRYLSAREPFLASIDSAFERALAERAAALASDDEIGRQLGDNLQTTFALAQAANVHWRKLDSIDHERFSAQVDGYRRQLEALEAALPADARELRSYVAAGHEFATAAKELARRVKRGGGWSRGDRMILRGVGGQWMVDGSPADALNAYGDLLRSDISPPLRYVAPVALLTDPY